MTGGSDTPGLGFSDAHQALITASAIKADVAEARGYRTVTVKAELGRLGFSRNQQCVPALLLPIRGVAGGIVNYMIRPDEPRKGKKGKPLKYEFPATSRMTLDVHPFIREQITDPSIPLWITEGSRKADAAISIGLCCIALPGVWNFRGTNEFGGKTALADWESIALNDDREVFIAYDSDVMLKDEVHDALARLAAFLKSRGAKVRYVYLPPGPGGTKVGLDDYLAEGHTVGDLLGLASTELRPSPRASAAAEAPYAIGETGMIWHRPTPEGPVDVPLANFSAVITDDVLLDDGLELRREFELEATVRGRVQRVTIPASQFPGMSWISEHLGAGAVHYPGMGIKDHLRCAILMLSGDLPEHRVYAHTGWRQIDEVWAYLHAGGAIGPDGALIGVEVSLTGPLSRISLPDPPAGDDLRAAVRAALVLLELLPPEVAFPLLGAVGLAVLRELLGEDAPDFVPWLHGPSGSFKSEVEALALAFFGDFSRQSLPVNFSATANAVERFLFEAKDALVAIDDYHPAGTHREQQAMDQTANRLLRGAGNSAGRARMYADTRLRPAMTPRALPIVSGERLPEGHSNSARMFPIGITRDAIDPAKLRQAQEAKPFYRVAMAGYLQSLSQRFDALRERLPARFRELRDELQQIGGHRREPGQVAHLLLSLETFLDFAVESNVLTRDAAAQHLQGARDVLLKLAQEHARTQADEAPEQVFLRLVGDGIAGKSAYLQDRRGGPPMDAERWGWERIERSGLFGGDSEWRHGPGAQLVGALDDEWVLLFPEQVYQFVVGAAKVAGRIFPVDQRSLLQRLDDAGLIEVKQEGNERRRKVNEWINGSTRRVIKLHRNAINPPTSQEEPPATHTGDGDPNPILPGLPGLPGPDGGKSNGVDRAQETIEWEAML
jgi:hypothetical protein